MDESIWILKFRRFKYICFRIDDKTKTFVLNDVISIQVRHFVLKFWEKKLDREMSLS